MADTFTCLRYHVVFSTKSRKNFINADMQQRLYQYMGGIIASKGGVLHSCGGTSDHVHMLVQSRPDIAIADLVRDVKANSSRWIHEISSQHYGFAWQSGYSAFTVSRSQIESVTTYIQDQMRHHRTRSFREELIELLDRHGVEYDVRFI